MPGKRKSLRQSDSLRPHGLYSPRNSPGQNTGVGSLSFLQGLFLTQESNRGPLHCRHMTGQHYQFNGHELGQTLGDSEERGDPVYFSPWDYKESDMT